MSDNGLLERALNEVQKRREMLDKIEPLVKELSGCPVLLDLWVSHASEDVWAVIPYNAQSLRAIRKHMPRGYRFSRSSVHGHAGTVSRAYSRSDMPDIIIDMSTLADGATCRLEEVGEKIEPVYKVVCD